MGYRKRSDLHRVVLDMFGRQPEIYQIFVFGREIEGKEDDYSDLDMVVCSADLAVTQENYRYLFGAISRIAGTFLLESATDSLSEMIMLEDYSPYQKIDLTIVNRIDTKQRAGFGPFHPVYEKWMDNESSPSQLTIQHVNTIQNQLADFLFSVPRFTKCLFRHDVDMYRRWKNISDMVLVLLCEKYTGWSRQSRPRGQLSAQETRFVYSTVSEPDKQRLDRIFPSDGELNVAVSYEYSIEFLIELSREKARYFGVPVDSRFIDYVSGFLATEIDRYLESRKRLYVAW